MFWYPSFMLQQMHWHYYEIYLSVGFFMIYKFGSTIPKIHCKLKIKQFRYFRKSELKKIPFIYLKSNFDQLENRICSLRDYRYLVQRLILM